MYSVVTNGMKLGTVAPKAIHHHFSRIANGYRDLRTTDSEPMALIVRELRELPRVEAADVGCGAGRYDLLLCNRLGSKLCLACADVNFDMLKVLGAYLKEYGLSNFMAVHSRAESLPFRNDVLNCVFSFNSVHHFNLLGFLKESARILRSGGYLFVYTRLQEQNNRNIWGRYFPDFCRKETRLYQMNTLTQTLAEVPALRVKSIEYFSYKRISTLEQLVERARASCYSTFLLYSAEELEEAIAGFRRNLDGHSREVHWVEWVDENVLFIIRKDGLCSPDAS